MKTEEIIGRDFGLFDHDYEDRRAHLIEKLSGARVLVVGGAGTIGKAVVKEIFQLSPRCLHVVDLSENNLVELVRDVRSSYGYLVDDFSTYCLDIGSVEFDVFWGWQGGYDYVFNLSALKHVRSEKDPFTLMRLVRVNILNAIKIKKLLDDAHSDRYFCVSTDKAANPVNLMGASKRIMELFLLRKGGSASVSLARFANVAFSDGSLLHGFNQRLLQRQPITAPLEISRYFISPRESGQLCVLSALVGKHGDILFPNPSEDTGFGLISFSDIAVRFLGANGYEPYFCESEDEARAKVSEIGGSGLWPVYFFKSDTTGEKPYEEFYTESESPDLSVFKSIGIVKANTIISEKLLDEFLSSISDMHSRGFWTKTDLVLQFRSLLPCLDYNDVGKYLESRM